MITPIPHDAIVLVAKEQVSCDLQGETAILSLTDGMYYTLDSVGSRIWKVLQDKGCTVGELHETLIDEYDVDAEQVGNDLQRLLHDLTKYGLVTIRS